MILKLIKSLLNQGLYLRLPPRAVEIQGPLEVLMIIERVY